MSIEDENDLIGLQNIGRLIGETLNEVSQFASVGVTTHDLDRFVSNKLRPLGVRSTPGHTYGFPGFACICVNDQAVHSVPGPRVLQDGDLVTIDLEADLDGYVADAARSFVVGMARRLDQRLHESAKKACYAAIHHARVGTQTRDLGRVVEQNVRRDGFRVIRSLYGHGVGRAAHESPSVPNFDDPRCRTRLHEGLVITIEPIICCGSGYVVDDGDWTIRTIDGSRSAHHEETIVVTQGEPVVLTAA